jgi:hypothetical protein
MSGKISAIKFKSESTLQKIEALSKKFNIPNTQQIISQFLFEKKESSGLLSGLSNNEYLQCYLELLLAPCHILIEGEQSPQQFFSFLEANVFLPIPQPRENICLFLQSYPREEILAQADDIKPALQQAILTYHSVLKMKNRLTDVAEQNFFWRLLTTFQSLEPNFKNLGKILATPFELGPRVFKSASSPNGDERPETSTIFTCLLEAMAGTRTSPAKEWRDYFLHSEFLQELANANLLSQRIPGSFSFPLEVSCDDPESFGKSFFAAFLAAFPRSLDSLSIEHFYNRDKNEWRSLSHRAFKLLNDLRVPSEKRPKEIQNISDLIPFTWLDVLLKTRPELRSEIFDGFLSIMGERESVWDSKDSVSQTHYVTAQSLIHHRSFILFLALPGGARLLTNTPKKIQDQFLNPSSWRKTDLPLFQELSPEELQGVMISINQAQLKLKSEESVWNFSLFIDHRPSVLQQLFELAVHAMPDKKKAHTPEQLQAQEDHPAAAAASDAVAGVFYPEATETFRQRRQQEKSRLSLPETLFDHP